MYVIISDCGTESRTSALCAKDSDSNPTDRIHIISFVRHLSEGNSKPPRISCQENPSKLDRSESV